MNFSAGTNGYVRLYNEFIIQWGLINSASRNIYSQWGGYAYPIDFNIYMNCFNTQLTTIDHEPFTIQFSFCFNGDYGEGYKLHARFISSLGGTATNIIQSEKIINQAYWIAIGSI